MELWLRIFVYVVAICTGVAVFIAAIRTGKPLRRLAVSGAQGMCALGLVDVLGAFTGVSLGVSWFTAGVGTVLGIPGIIGLLLMRLVLRG